MDKDLIIKQVQDILDNYKLNMKALSINTVNYKPHPPIIGLNTMQASRDSIFILNDAPCGMRGCKLKLSEHHGDVVLFLKLMEPIKKNDAQLPLVGIGILLELNEIDGISFVSHNKECVFI